MNTESVTTFDIRGHRLCGKASIGAKTAFRYSIHPTEQNVNFAVIAGRIFSTD